MITISKYNYNYIKIKLNTKKHTFDLAKDIIKEMPVRKFLHKKKVWLIPIRDIVLLMKKFKTDGIKYKIEKFKIIKNLHSDYVRWKKEQLECKKFYTIVEPNKKKIKFYKKEMDVLSKKQYPFQSVGSYFAFNSDASIICDPVGLGKTIQALAVCEKRFNEGETNFNLIICPSTLKKNWGYEIEKFTNKKYAIVNGHKANRKRIYKKSYLVDYLIINYDVLDNDYELLKEFLLDKDGYRINLIIDEMQYVNNRRTKRAKATKKISKYVLYITGLSATLLENKVTDLFNSFNIIDETIFGDQKQYFSFVNRHCKLNYFGNIIGYVKPKLIKKRMSPFFIRRLKEDVLDELPERIENNYWISLDGEQRKFYNDMKKKLVDKISDMEKRHKIIMADILPMLIYLRQCVLSTKLVGHEENISTKTKELFSILSSLNKNDKVVLFCHHPEMIELLYEDISSSGVECIGIHGKPKMKHFCPINDRIEVINEFNEDKNIKILLTSDILAEGVNIPSANYLINFDLLFNPQKIEQRIGRIDRIGTKHKSINIINLIAENTVEDNVYEKFYSKRSMAKDLIDDNREEKRLTIKNIKNIFDL